MEKRQIYTELIAAVNHVLHGTALPAHIHWGRLIELAQRHRLTGFVYRCISGRNDVSPAQIQQIETIYFTAVGDHIRQEHYARALFEELHRREIRYMPMRGWCMRALYPEPTWRTSGDLELLCDAEKLEELGEILSGYGFHCVAVTETEAVWALDHVRIILHTALIPISEAVTAYFGDAWERFLTDDGVEYRMTDEDYCLYILTQLSYLMVIDRISIRMILDLYVYRNAKPNLDRGKLEAELEKLGILRFAHAIEALCEVWFGGAEQTDDLMLLGSYIASNSAYTADADDSKKRRIYVIFPPYHVMKRRYPVLRLCPVLLPVFWAVRGFACIFSRHRDKIRREGGREATLRSVKTRERVCSITGLDLGGTNTEK